MKKGEGSATGLQSLPPPALSAEARSVRLGPTGPVDVGPGGQVLDIHDVRRRRQTPGNMIQGAVDVNRLDVPAAVRLSGWLGRETDAVSLNHVHHPWPDGQAIAVAAAAAAAAPTRAERSASPSVAMPD